jgi:hypothetical protein
MGSASNRRSRRAMLDRQTEAKLLWENKIAIKICKLIFLFCIKIFHRHIMSWRHYRPNDDMTGRGKFQCGSCTSQKGTGYLVIWLLAILDW